MKVKNPYEEPLCGNAVIKVIPQFCIAHLHCAEVISALNA